jgi:hypothetical protein
MLTRDVLESNAKPPMRAKWLWTRVHGNVLFVLSVDYFEILEDGCSQGRG